MQAEKIHGTEKPGNGRDSPDTGNPLEKEWMTVEELGKLLGLKKTARYWLLHKGYFQSKVIGGKTWVDVQSFEDWYANQRNYRKADWEAPGKGLKQRSYSVREFAGILGITDQAAYSLIKKESIRTILVDGETKILQETFTAWYAGQDRYRTKEERTEDADVENTTLTMPEMMRPGTAPM